MNQTTLAFFIQLSRPRFWSYLAGPFSIGFLASIESFSQLSSFTFWGWLFFFLFPANLLLYGINDISDEDTDAFNQKKGTKEIRITFVNKTVVSRLMQILLLVFFLFGLLCTQTLLEKSVFFLFLFLTYSYSMQPFRFKARPFIDSASNVLYLLPGIFAFVINTNQLPPLWVIIAGSCWTFSMHLFSAVPDISADKKAGLQTTAIFFGQKRSLLLCSILWGITSVVFIANYSHPFSYLSLLYVLLPVYTLHFPKRIEKVYWWFPYVNTGFGATLFFLVLLKKYLY